MVVCVGVGCGCVCMPIGVRGASRSGEIELVCGSACATSGGGVSLSGRDRAEVGGWGATGCVVTL